MPILLMGQALVAGSYREAASPADNLTDAAALAGITLANPDGRVLSEAFETQKRQGR